MKPFFAWRAKPQIGKLQHSPVLGIDKPFKEYAAPPTWTGSKAQPGIGDQDIMDGGR